MVRFNKLTKTFQKEARRFAEDETADTTGSANIQRYQNLPMHAYPLTTGLARVNMVRAKPRSRLCTPERSGRKGLLVDGDRPQPPDAAASVRGLSNTWNRILVDAGECGCYHDFA